MQFEKTIAINAPIDRVFRLVSDHDLAVLWMQGLEETTYPDPIDWQSPVGARFRQRIREMGKSVQYDGEVLAYDNPYRVAVRLSHPRFLMELDYRLSQKPSHVDLSYRLRLLEGDPLVQKLTRMMGWYSQRVADQQLRRIREIAESDRSFGPTSQ